MIELAYKIVGSGKKKVIFLHELMGDHKNYNSILPYLNSENFTYIFTDLRGYGLSKDIKGSYTIEEASNDVKNLITTLKLKDVYIVAHSMSTMIAQKLALIDSRIKSLVLVTPIPASGVKAPEIQKQALLKQMKENKNLIEDIVNSSSKRYNQSWKNSRIKMAYEASTIEARVGYMEMYMNTDFLEEAKTIDIPIRVIVGRHDFPVFGLNSIKKIFELTYKDFKIVECQEAGHYPMIECPIYFATKIEEFCN